MEHFEFDDFGQFGGQSDDYLVWTGSAAYWDVIQWQAGGFSKFIARVSGKDPFGRTQVVTQYEASPSFSPTAVGHYAVIGHADNGTIVTGFSNFVSTVELLSDPGFKEGANSSGWIQQRTPTGGDTFDTNFIEDIGEQYPSALLGGTPLTSDVISSSNDILITKPTDVAAGAVGDFQISGMVSVSTEEDFNETIPYDTLTMEIVDLNSGSVISSTQIANNTSVRAGTFRFTSNQLNFQDFNNRRVQVVFRANNDEIFGTTFIVSEVQFNLTFE